MILQIEFGDPFEEPDRGGHTSEQFVWRDQIRIAFWRVHPSGRELVWVFLTDYCAGQKLPRR